MIKIRDVCKSFGSHEALKHINLDIVEGETLAIIGGSGSGKSTLLRLLIGLDRPTSGEIYIMGSPIANMSEKQLDELRMNMGMVFQYSALFDSMTVGENVAFGIREHTDYPEEKIRA
ncbi:MAG: ATP-binding cassette domain-containing protein, partial [Selenomonadaceae bacterium]|nr:ATP-binding cassette domain-containing protein [Selenomonadaceae bacterium]